MTAPTARWKVAGGASKNYSKPRAGTHEPARRARSRKRLLRTTPFRQASTTRGRARATATERRNKPPTPCGAKGWKSACCAGVPARATWARCVTRAPPTGIYGARQTVTRTSPALLGRNACVTLQKDRRPTRTQNHLRFYGHQFDMRGKEGAEGWQGSQEGATWRKNDFNTCALCHQRPKNGFQTPQAALERQSVVATARMPHAGGGGAGVPETNTRNLPSACCLLLGVAHLAPSSPQLATPPPLHGTSLREDTPCSPLIQHTLGGLESVGRRLSPTRHSFGGCGANAVP